MRYTLALLWVALAAACLLLGGQAVLGLVAAFGVGEPRGAGPAEDGAAPAAAGSSEQAAQRLKTWSEFFEQIAGSDVLATPRKRDVEVTRVETIRAQAEAWERVHLAGELAAHFTRLARDMSLGEDASAAANDARPTRDELDARRRELVRFMALYDGQYAKKLPESAALAKLVRSDIASLDRRIARLDELAAIDREMAEARLLFRQNAFARCLEKLAENPLNRVDSSSLRQEIERLREKCEYRVEWASLRAMPRKTESDLAEIDRFLERFSQFRGGSRQEQLAYRQAEGWRATLEKNLLLEEFERAAASLRGGGDFEQLLAQALGIAEHSGARPADKARLRAVFREWLLDKGLAPLEPPRSLRGIDEAVTASGVRWLGVFYLPAGTDAYRYWTSRESRSSGRLPRGEVPPSPIPAQQFKGEGPSDAGEHPYLRPHVPDTPAYTAWARQFNQALAALRQDGTERRQWHDFAQDCARLQGQVERYQEHFGGGHAADSECENWPDVLEDYAALAGKVADRWEQVTDLLRKE